MDEVTIKQMMIEYKQAIDKAAFLKQQIESAVIRLGKSVETDEMVAKLFPKTDLYRADVFLDYK